MGSLCRPATNALASKSGVKISGYELVREDVEAPLREGQVPHGKLDPKVGDRLERWIESEGQLLGEEVIRVMTNTRNLTGDVALGGAQKVISCPGRQRVNAAGNPCWPFFQIDPYRRTCAGMAGFGIWSRSWSASTRR